MNMDKNKRIGRHTVKLESEVYITAASSTAGRKEGEGPLKGLFFIVLEDDMYGEMSWEMAESKLVRETFIRVANKDGKTAKDIDICLSGDLLNQVSASTFGVRDLNIPYLGVYGACSTMGETMGLGAMLIDGGFAKNIIAGASSHFCAAEKQYRAPLGMGNQRPPTTTWTVTGDGAVVLSCFEKIGAPVITEVLTGEITDLGIKDTNNMGAAMAPAAARPARPRAALWASRPPSAWEAAPPEADAAALAEAAAVSAAAAVPAAAPPEVPAVPAAPAAAVPTAAVPAVPASTVWARSSAAEPLRLLTTASFCRKYTRNGSAL